MPEGDPVGSLLLTLVLIAVNAFFAMSEIAVITFNDVKLRHLAEQGNKKAKILYNLTSEESRFLSTIQVGITLAGMFSSAVAAETFTAYIVYWMRDLPISSDTVHAVALVVITLLLSFITLVFGELVPKRIAMNNPEEMSFFAAYPLKFVSVVANPFVKLLSFTTNAVLRLIGIDPDEQNPDVTAEEIRMMLDAGEEDGTIEEEDSEMIQNIFDLDDTEVGDLMTHRTELVALDVDDSLQKIVDTAIAEGHSRFPVCDKNIDNIVGMLHIKDLMGVMLNTPEEFDLRQYVRSVLYLPESMTIKKALETFRSEKAQFAIVVDEYGGTAGAVTMEDILESIVGDIEDEYDNEAEDIVPQADGSYLVSGMAYLQDVQDELDTIFTDADDDYDTISGYFVDRLGRLPAEDEAPEIEAAGWLMKAVSVKEHRVDQISITKLETAESDSIEE